MNRQHRRMRLVKGGNHTQVLKRINRKRALQEAAFLEKESIQETTFLKGMSQSQEARMEVEILKRVNQRGGRLHQRRDGRSGWKAVVKVRGRGIRGIRRE